MIRVDLEPFWLFGPDSADVLVWGETLQGLEPASVIVGGHEQLKVVRQLLMIGVVVPFDSRVLNRPVHPLDLAVGPWMVWFGQPVLDTVLAAEPVE